MLNSKIWHSDKLSNIKHNYSMEAGQTQAEATFPPEVTSFLKIAKGEFSDKDYVALLRLLVSFLCEAKSCLEQLHNVRNMVKHLPKLELALNISLPEEYRTTEISTAMVKAFVAEFMEEAGDIHIEFVRCTCFFRNKEISPVEYYARVMSLMDHHPLLFKKFQLLFPNINQAAANNQESLPSENILQDYKRVNELMMEIANKIREKEDFENKPIVDLAEEIKEAFARSDTNKFRKAKRKLKAFFEGYTRVHISIFKCIQLYILGIINIKEFTELTEPLPNVSAEEKAKVTKMLARRCDSRRQFSWLCRPSSYLAQTQCRTVGSYMKLPDDYPSFASTGRETNELNDNWVSIASKFESSSFKILRKSDFEERSCDYEDSMFKIDMTISCCELVMASLEDVLREIHTMPKEHVYSRCTQGALGRLIRKLLKGNAKDLLKQIRENPAEGVEDFLRRVRRHSEIHKKVKKDIATRWSEVCKERHPKVIDYRVPYFKQMERECLNIMSFYIEIKDRFYQIRTYSTSRYVNKDAVYCNSFPTLPPEALHTTRIPGDEASRLSENKANGLLSPQLLLRFDNPKAFAETYQLLLKQMLKKCTSDTEKNKVKFAFDSIMTEFFKFDVTKVNPDTAEDLTAAELKKLASEQFFDKRLRNIHLHILDVWREVGSGMQRPGRKTQSPDRTPESAEERRSEAKEADNPETEDDEESEDMDEEVDEEDDEEVAEEWLEEDEEDQADAVPHMEFFEEGNGCFLPNPRESKAVFYGTLEFYSFFRFFHCIYERLMKGRVLAARGVEEKIKKRSHQRMQEQHKERLKQEQFEDVYMRGLNLLLSNRMENAKYETFCKHCLNSQAYLMYGLDKVIGSAAKMFIECVLYTKHSFDVLEYYLEQPRNYPEVVYFAHYNRHFMDAKESFRMHFCSRVKVLSVHYYVSPYAYREKSYCRALQKFVDSDMALGLGHCRRRFDQSEVMKSDGPGMRGVSGEDVITKQGVEYKATQEDHEWKLYYEPGGEDFVLRKDELGPNEVFAAQVAKAALFEKWLEACCDMQT